MRACDNRRRQEESKLSRFPEAALLRDVQTTLSHAAYRYLHAALDASDADVRGLCARIAVDKTEERHSVFQLLRQMGEEEAPSASHERLAALRRRSEEILRRMEGPSRGADRERAASSSRADQPAGR